MSAQLIEPHPGSAITEDTVLDVSIEYEIRPFDSSRRYGIAPVFADHRGNQRTFNAQPNMLDILPLNKAKGTVNLRYPIRKEWQDARLERPVKVFFYLLEERANGGSVVLAARGPILLNEDGVPSNR